MARIPLISSDDPDADPAAVRALRKAAEQQGMEANVHRALAHHPELMEKIFEAADLAYFNGTVPRAQGELAYYTSAVTNNCHY
jgi:DNA-binding GntR family transcriptional regulator